MTLSILVLVVFLIGLGIFVSIFFFVKHAQYMREVSTKLKLIILPETGGQQVKVVNVDFAKNWVANPDKDGNLPRYYFNKENLWSSRYPNDPFLGITALCVPIATGYYRKNCPEPITSHPLEPLVTSESIGAAIDEEFELVLKRISSTMLKLEKQLTEALSGHLNKLAVYGLLLIVLIMCVISLYFSYNASAQSKAILQAFGLR
jgi:hypothetical protein